MNSIHLHLLVVGYIVFRFYLSSSRFSVHFIVFVVAVDTYAAHCRGEKEIIIR